MPRAKVFLLSMLILIACRKGKLIETAKANAEQYALARCECDKLERQKPPGDITLCTEQMQQARRYLMFNFEMGKFSQKEQAEVNEHGEKVYRDCLAKSMP